MRRGLTSLPHLFYPANNSLTSTIKKTGSLGIAVEVPGFRGVQAPGSAGLPAHVNHETQVGEVPLGSGSTSYPTLGDWLGWMVL
jgi:hypothetical protein